MLVLVLGSFLIIAGVLSIRFPDLSKALFQYDMAQWERLGSPDGYSFSDLGKTIGLYSWVLSYGYQNSQSEEVQILGTQARKRAKFAKYIMQTGVALIVIGFVASLSGF